MHKNVLINVIERLVLFILQIKVRKIKPSGHHYTFGEKIR